VLGRSRVGMPGEDLGVAELDADDEVAKLQSFVTVGAC
jgi:hypothetical protein